MRSDPQLGRAPADLIEALDAVAKSLGWSRTQLVVKILARDVRVMHAMMDADPVGTKRATDRTHKQLVQRATPATPKLTSTQQELVEALKRSLKPVTKRKGAGLHSCGVPTHRHSSERLAAQCRKSRSVPRCDECGIALPRHRHGCSKKGAGQTAGYARDRATCPYCGRVFGVQPPAGGDDSADVFPRHNARIDGFGPRSEQPKCKGSRFEVRDRDYVTNAAEKGQTATKRRRAKS